MPSPISRLRRLYPYLTPSWGEDDQEREGFMLDKTQGGIPLIRTPYDPPFHPTQVARRSKVAETWRTGRDDPQWNTEYSAAFPISAVTGQVNPDQGYGIYNKGPLDPGYEPPPALRRPPLTAPSDIDRIAVLGEPQPSVPPLLMRTSDSPAAPAYDPALVGELTRQMPALRNPDERISDDRLAQIGAPPMVIRRDGRPTTKFIGEGTSEERLGVRRQALEQYEPQKESVKKLLLRTALNTLRGGLIGEGGAADTLLGPGGVLDRHGIDRVWQQQQLGQTDERLGQLRTDRRAGLQDRLLESQVLENEAQAARALREPTVPPIKPASIFTGAEDVEDEAGNVIVVGPDGKPIINPSTGQPYVRRRLKPPPVKPDTAPTQRADLVDNIAAAEREKASLGPPPQTMIDDVNQWGEVTGKKVNPAYTHWAARFQKLDDDIRNWKVSLGKVPELASTSSELNPTEQRIYDAAAKNPKLDPNEAVRRYREGRRAGRF